MAHITKLIREIRRRPGIYIGKRCPVRLHLYLQGYIHGVGQVQDTYVLEAFQEFVSERFQIRSSHSWAEIILFHSEGPIDGFHKFGELFDQFLDSHPGFSTSDGAE